MTTIKDVARLAGVSTSTVSHVLNKTRFVSEDTCRKVSEAVFQLKYRPSSIARSLKVQRTRTLGMLVTASRNPFFAELVQAVERRCYERGYTLFLSNTEGDVARMEANINALEERRVDGLLLLCSEVNNDTLRFLEVERSTPTVVFDWGPESDHVDRIFDNSTDGGMEATRHLIANGHTRIGCLTGPLERRSAIERLAGFRAAMAEAGLPVREEWIMEGDYDCPGGIRAVDRLCSLAQRPSALFVCNDMMAIGVLHRAAELGMDVPGELSVIGYDDIYLSRYTTPPLTTVHQPKSEIAALAVDALVDRLDSNRTRGGVIRVEPRFVERASVRDLNGPLRARLASPQKG